ncbi:hypothetical protein L1049_002397 [Liquidambar formosana]|uniref:Integrator complex subunit 7-like C-terminal domain-containing protein n=1 Tax=Liquidambar formosana TaxID=63359 RepID=A0AAP0NFK7_LIQFO
MVTSSKILPAVRLAGVRAFAKTGSSSSLAYRTYKAGVKLVLDSSEEDFSVAMLISLSKIACKSMLLISEQVELLYTFLTQETTLRMQAMALRCVHFILVWGVVSDFPVTAHLVTTLFSMLDEPKFSSALQCEALLILHKILLYNLPNLPCMDMLEFSKLLTNVENASQSPIRLKRLLAISVLVNISSKLRERTELESGKVSFTSLPSRVISLAIVQINLLVKQVLEFCQTDSEVVREGQRLLNLLLLLVVEHPNLGIFALESMVNMMHDRVMAIIQPELVNEILEYEGEKSTSIRSKLMFYVHKFLVACLEILNEAGAITKQVLHKVKLMVKHVHQCSVFDWYTHTIYSLLLHFHVMWDSIENENEESYKLDRNLDMSVLVNLVEPGVKRLPGNDNWSAYRAGKYAACQGAWLTASFIFEQLVTKVQSHSCYCWLKFLAQLAHSERKIQLLFLPKLGSSLVNWLEVNKIFITPSWDDLCEATQDAAGNVNLPDCCEKLVRAYESLSFSQERLETIVTSGEAFYFQRWFLAIRIKVLETVLDILKLLGTSPLNQDNITNSEQVASSDKVNSPKLHQQINSLYSLTQISFRLKRLAQEFDLISTCFIGMDGKSLKIISSLALSCSLLAFSTGFALFIQNLPSCGLENLGNSSHAMLVQNLVGRLWHIDHETITNLWFLLKVSGHPNTSFHLLSRNQIMSIGCEARYILSVCSYAVTGVIRLQNEVNRVRSEEILSRVAKDGLQLLSDIIKKWMCIPFRTPKYFFQVRPCAGAVLFAFNTDTRNPDNISVSLGFHLSLNLCLQLKNVPPDLTVRLTKLYCILHCKTSFQIPRPNGENKGQTWLGCRAWEMMIW